MRFVVSMYDNGNLIARNSLDNIPGESTEETVDRAKDAISRDRRRGTILTEQQEQDLAIVADAFGNLVRDTLPNDQSASRTVIVGNGNAQVYYDEVFLGESQNKITATLEAHNSAWLAETQDFLEQVFGKAS